MGVKRQFDSRDGDGQAAKRYKQNEGQEGRSSSFANSNSKWQKHKTNTAKPDSSNWIKKRARTIERRLGRGPDSLPANVRQNLERELAALRQQVETREDKRQRSHMIGKYHMVRFFERKKASRLEKQLRKRLQTVDNDAEKAALEADLHIAVVDGLYARYFPLMERYVSLYPVSSAETANEGDDKVTEQKKSKSIKSSIDDQAGTSWIGNQSSAAKALHAPRPPMWTEVEALYAKGGEAALEKQLRERRPPVKKATAQETAISAAAVEKKEKRDKEKQRKEKGEKIGTPNKTDDRDDDDDNNGFFDGLF